MVRLPSEILQQLALAVGPERVRTAAQEIAPFLTDWRKRYSGPSDAVIFPGSTGEVAQVIRICHDHRIAVIPQGGNTGQSGGAVPLPGQSSNIILNLSRLNRIQALDKANNTMTVEAGVILQTIQETAEAEGRFFPLSLGAEGSCQIGGNLSTNAGGTNVLRYGNARDLVLGLEVVLPNGEILSNLKTLRKNNTGYDLKGIFLAAEGTLGVITGAVLKLFARPVERAVAWVAVGSLVKAVELLTHIRGSLEPRLSAYEYISQEQLDLVTRYVPSNHAPMAKRHTGYVLIELSDSILSNTLTPALEACLGEAMEQGLIVDAIIAANEAQAKALWKIRHSVSEANVAHGVSLNHDVAVPTSSLPAFVAQASARIEARFPAADVITVAHLGDGNVHFLVIFPRAFWGQLDDSEAYAAVVKKTVYDIANEFSGTFSAEHGVGQSLTVELERYKTAPELLLMRQIKSLLDPHGIMNPGKVLRDVSPSHR